MLSHIKIEDILTKDPKEEARPTTCVVCGDHTKSYHYETPSCYGCKTFFRRAIIGKKKYVCTNNDRCIINKDTRCICRSCRLKKCYDVGMNPNAVGVMTMLRKKKAMQSALIKKEVDIKMEEKPSTSELVLPSLSTTFNDTLSTIDNVVYIESKHEFLRHSNFCPYDEKLSLSDLLNMPTSFSYMNKYHMVHVWPRVDAAQIAKMNGYQLQNMGLKSWFFFDLLMSVDYLKTLDVFQMLPRKDQYHLCLDVALSIAHLSRSYYAFLMGGEIVIYPDGTYPFIHRENLMDVETILKAGKVKSFRQLNPDRAHFCLMKAITAYATTSLLIDHHSMSQIEREKSKYAKILLRYLQEKFGVEQGVKKFADSLALICEFVTMAKKYSSIYHSCRHCFNETLFRRPEQKLTCELRRCHENLYEEY